MNKLSFLFLALTAVLCSCNNEKLKNEITSLQNKIDSLQTVANNLSSELDGYKYSPEKLCADIESLYNSKNEKQLKDIADKLRKYHPEAPQLKQVEGYLASIDQKKKEEAEKLRAERMKAVDILKKNYDDVSDNTWYYSKVVNHRNWSNMASLYMGKNSSTVWLRLRMSYYGSDWIFFEKAYLSYDGNTLPISFDRYKDKESDNSGGMVWEWIDVPVDASMITYLNAFVNSGSAKMRLSGKYTETRNLTDKEKKAMKEILLAYDVLKKGA